MSKKTIEVVELFAGVGGFRLGLEGWKGKSASSGYKRKLNSRFKVVWSNQYEPLTKKIQHASEVYSSRWPEDKSHSNEDIEDVIEKKFDTIKDHDLLVGGFPCQDYSVATTLRNSKGMEGKKGVLWWSIYNIIKLKKEKKPRYLLLENVDRLLISPSNQRGRDFAVILSCLSELGYAVEWRVINAADYGMPQRRRRVFIMAYHWDTNIYKELSELNPFDIITKRGVLADALPVKVNNSKFFAGSVSNDKVKVSGEFNKNKKTSPFQNSGVLIGENFYTTKVYPNYKGRKKVVLGDVLEPIENVPDEFIIKDTPLKQPKRKIQIDGTVKKIKTTKELWIYLKGSKKEIKVNRQFGYKYKYGEGKMVFPEDLEKPSRTIITGEGGVSPSRFKHVVEQDGILRRLMPIELERLNMFPDNHTYHPIVNSNKRAFLMGNALVIGLVEKIGLSLSNMIEN